MKRQEKRSRKKQLKRKEVSFLGVPGRKRGEKSRRGKASGGSMKKNKLKAEIGEGGRGSRTGKHSLEPEGILEPQKGRGES